MPEGALTPEAASRLSDMAQHQSARFVDRAVEVADALRRLAADVERDARLQPAREAQSQHAVVAQRIVHTVTWGVANLHLDMLVTLAGDADGAAAYVAAERLKAQHAIELVAARAQGYQDVMDDLPRQGDQAGG